MTHVVEVLPRLTDVQLQLARGESVLLFAPRGHGKRHAIDRLASIFRADGSVCISLSSKTRIGNRLDYTEFWAQCARTFGLKPRRQTLDVNEFIERLTTHLRDEHRDVYVFLAGAERGNEANHWALLAAFNHLLRRQAERGLSRLRVLGTDDYSIFLYQAGIWRESELERYEKNHWLPLNAAEIDVGFKRMVPNADAAFDGMAAAELVMRRTGGHTGLVQEVLHAAMSRGFDAVSGLLGDFDSALWRESHTLAVLARAIDEDPLGYSTTALEYEEPAFAERNSPRVHVLQQFGVLQRADVAHIRLCRGAVASMMRSIHDHATVARTRLGRVAEATGKYHFEPDELRLDDDDFVIVHISDIHVGDTYRFKLTWPGGAMNAGERELGEMIQEDLQSLDLIGRIDGVVVSGDLTTKGLMQEFTRAREVIGDIVTRLGVAHDRVVFVPGNHDVLWEPGAMAVQQRPAASLENYDTFRELVRRQRQPTSSMISIVSRSGRRKLRIVELDSNRVEGPEAAGIGYVATDSIVAAERELELDDKRERENGRKSTDVLTWLVLHHHVFPASNASLDAAARRSVSMLANSPEVLQFANRCGAELILHGHEHQPSVSVVRRWPVDSARPFSPVVSLGAGSVSAKRDELGLFSRNHYYVICRRVDETIIRSRTLGESGIRFTTHDDLRV